MDSCNSCFSPLTQSADWGETNLALKGERHALTCMHTYHVTRISQAVNTSKKCPTCQDDIKEDVIETLQSRNAANNKYVHTYIQDAAKKKTLKRKDLEIAH